MKQRLLLLLSLAALLSGCGITPATSSSVEATTEPASSRETPSEEPSEEPSLSSEEETPSSGSEAPSSVDGAIVLTKNHEGAPVSILHPEIQRYCDDMYAAAEAQGITGDKRYQIQEVDKSKSGYLCPNVFVTAYQGTSPNNDRDNFQPIELAWNAVSGYSGKYVVKYSTKADLSDWKQVETDTNAAELINLRCDTTYYWKAETADKSHDSQIGSFHTKGYFRDITCGPAYNVRDWGGKMTASGRKTKQGVLYRGGEIITTPFNQMGVNQPHIVTCDATTVKVMHDDLKIRKEIDLRNAGAETNYQEKSCLGDDVQFLKKASGSGYATMWNNGGSVIKEILNIIATGTEESAVYFHCWGGADRTGTLGFLLDGLCGVSFLEAIMDYEFTSFDTIHTRRRDSQVNDGQFNYDFRPLISGMKSSTYYSQSATKTFADVVERWMKGKLGMSQTEIDNLKNALLEPVA